MKANNMDAFQDLAATIADEEKAAVARSIAERLAAIQDQPDGPVRARIHAAAAMIGGAELHAALEGPQATARQLRRLADRIEAGQGPSH